MQQCTLYIVYIGLPVHKRIFVFHSTPLPVYRVARAGKDNHTSELLLCDMRCRQLITSEAHGL